MRSTPQRLAMRLIRLYPRAWRERYEDEILALIEDSGASVGTLVDLTTALVKEWVFAISGRRPSEVTRVGWAGVRDMLLWTAAAMGLSVLAVKIASGLHAFGVVLGTPFLGWPLFVNILAPLRAMVGMLAWRGLSKRFAVTRIELSLWLFAIFASSLVLALTEFSSGRMGPEAWWNFALRGMSIQMLTLYTMQQIQRMHRLRELRASKAVSRARVPRFPLGLGPPA